ncbi:pyrimidine utilization protein D [Chenggangzhangella methanolivorans]|uniref:pyrimidine utilization protein D n=1 Tax=Chenggangzhangella methanolivorans TaxID=1437009 RepID=UPI0021BDD459|nr:pyrimidine utilization protein D [Chenggangzhangella methanolivorans]
MLLSTGLGGFGAFWKPQLAALEQRFRVIVYDHRGCGANAGPLPNGYAIAHMADDVVEILDAAGVGRCHFAGHALGGLVGLELALKSPERLATLTLVNAWAAVSLHTLRCFEARLALLRHVGVEAYVKAQPIFLYSAAHAAANAEAIDREVAHAIAAFQGEETLLRRVSALSAFDVRDRLGEIAVPTLVAASRDDVLAPWTASRDLAERLPAAELWMAESGGHAFTVVDPKPFNDVLLHFLAKGGMPASSSNAADGLS